MAPAQFRIGSIVQTLCVDEQPIEIKEKKLIILNPIHTVAYIIHIPRKKRTYEPIRNRALDIINNISTTELTENTEAPLGAKHFIFFSQNEKNRSLIFCFSQKIKLGALGELGG